MMAHRHGPARALRHRGQPLEPGAQRQDDARCEQIEQLVRISREFGREVANGKEAREICKIGVFYDSDRGDAGHQRLRAEPRCRPTASCNPGGVREHSMSEATVLIVPGLRDHVPDHWQTLLAARLPRVRTVPPMGRADLDCARRSRRSSAKRTRSTGRSSSSPTAAAWSWWPTGRNRRSVRFAARCSRRRRISSSPCRTVIRRSRSCGRAAGCRFRAILCRSGASSRRAATIPWATSSASPSSPRLGQQTGRSRRGRPPQSGLRLRRMAGCRGPHFRTG